MDIKPDTFWARVTEAFNTTEVQEIADKTGYKYQSVRRWKLEELPTIKTLKLISDLTNRSIHWLLTGEGEKTVNKKTLPVSKSLHNNTATESKKDETVELIELKLSGNYEINIAPNRIEIRGNILKLQRRT